MVDVLKKLNQLYGLLGRETERFSLACREKCPDCCTVNVTATSLEAAFIFSRLEEDEILKMIRRLRAGFPDQRFTPAITTNGFSRACMEDLPIPEEENNPDWGACPLLEDGRCTIYRVRPLGCRVMMSERLCQNKGIAQMPSFVLTLSNILGQTLEQMDLTGFSGNLSDVLAIYAQVWESGKTQEDGTLYLSLDNIGEFDRKGIFLRNQPIPALMVPPEHRHDTASLIREIRDLDRED